MGCADGKLEGERVGTDVGFQDGTLVGLLEGTDKALWEPMWGIRRIV